MKTARNPVASSARAMTNGLKPANFLADVFRPTAASAVSSAQRERSAAKSATAAGRNPSDLRVATVRGPGRNQVSAGSGFVTSDRCPLPIR
jgi:hypothetical protein